MIVSSTQAAGRELLVVLGRVTDAFQALGADSGREVGKEQHDLNESVMVGLRLAILGKAIADKSCFA